MTLKRYDFTSFEQYSESGASSLYNALAVIDENGWLNSDIMTECKSWKTALKRFFKLLGDDSRIDGWYECMRESAENGCFTANDYNMGYVSRNSSPGWSYRIEEINRGVWYIFLNVRYEEYPEEKTYTREEVEAILLKSEKAQAEAQRLIAELRPDKNKEEENTMDYNYLNAVKADVLDYIREEIDLTEWAGKRDELAEELDERLWIADSVTGNASGSYTFNSWRAEEYLAHNWDLLQEALEDFGMNDVNPIAKGPEWCDVTIRCYLLGQAIWEALDELEDSGELLED